MPDFEILKILIGHTLSKGEWNISKTNGLVTATHKELSHLPSRPSL